MTEIVIKGRVEDALPSWGDVEVGDYVVVKSKRFGKPRIAVRVAFRIAGLRDANSAVVYPNGDWDKIDDLEVVEIIDKVTINWS